MERCAKSPIYTSVKSTFSKTAPSKVESLSTALTKTAPVKSEKSNTTLSATAFEKSTPLKSAFATYDFDNWASVSCAPRRFALENIPPDRSNLDRSTLRKSHSRRSRSLSRAALAWPMAEEEGRQRFVFARSIGGNFGIGRPFVGMGTVNSAEVANTNSALEAV